MICYRDMTFCAGDGCSKFDTCPRTLTADVRERAEKSGLHIAQFTDPKALPCHSDNEKNK